jgi:hypothetical protein
MSPLPTCLIKSDEGRPKQLLTDAPLGFYDHARSSALSPRTHWQRLCGVLVPWHQNLDKTSQLSGYKPFEC